MIPWSRVTAEVDVWDPNSPVTGCEGNGETALISLATWISGDLRWGVTYDSYDHHLMTGIFIENKCWPLFYGHL